MNGPRNTGPEYTGKHRRDSGPGALPPAWGSRADSRARADSRSRPAADGRSGAGAPPTSVSGAAPGLRPESGMWSDAG
jgi:hypothetical protein